MHMPSPGHAKEDDGLGNAVLGTGLKPVTPAGQTVIADLDINGQIFQKKEGLEDLHGVSC